MKTMIAAVLLIAAGALKTCGAKFDRPQPDGVRSLASFPTRIQGKYSAADGQSVVSISDRMIKRHYNFDIKEHKDSINVPYRVVGDTLIFEEEGGERKAVVKGDTIIIHIDGIDTTFGISEDNILKKFKGYYFLNERNDKGYWEVKKLSLQKGVLTVSSTTEDDITKLNKIIKATSDTTPTYFSLTRRQFRSFLRQKGFGEKESFKRIAGSGR